MSIKENARYVRKWLTAHKWHFTENTMHDGVIGFKMAVSADCEMFKGYEIRMYCRESDVQSLFYLPISMPPKRKNEVLEYVNRVNYRFRLGKFTVDLRDGETRWETLKSSADMKADLDDAMDDLIGFPGFVLDKYAPGLAMVICGAKSAEEAYLECDADKPPDEEAPGGGPSEGGEVPPEGEVAAEPGEIVLPVPKCKKSKKRKPKVEPKEDPPAEEAPKDGIRNYSLEGLNLTTPVPLADIVRAVKRFRDGTGRPDVDAPRLNILLSGAPGSGKSAFVKYLAGEVGAPLRVLKASDLISHYSGMTEKNIAEAFGEAKANGEILFLDEIDSFLQDRKGATKSWEVTQVNELLQQMEEFGGILIGATNFADNLDKAVLRRFTYKLKFDYLTDEGKGIFFERYFKTPLTEEEKVRLNAIANLTPGDFRTVREELYYLSDRQTNDERLRALEAESVAKGRESARIGF